MERGDDRNHPAIAVAPLEQNGGLANDDSQLDVEHSCNHRMLHNRGKLAGRSRHRVVHLVQWAARRLSRRYPQRRRDDRTVELEAVHEGHHLGRPG